MATRMMAVPLSAEEEAMMAALDTPEALGEPRRWGLGVFGLLAATAAAVAGIVFLARPPAANAAPSPLPQQPPEAPPRAESIPLKFTEIADRALSSRRIGRREAEFLQGLANVARNPETRNQTPLTDEQVARLRTVLREIRNSNITVVG